MRGYSEALLTKLRRFRGTPEAFRGTPTPSESSPRDARDETAMAEGREGLGLGQQAILDLWGEGGGVREGGRCGRHVMRIMRRGERSHATGGSIQRVGTAPP